MLPFLFNLVNVSPTNKKPHVEQRLGNRLNEAHLSLEISKLSKIIRHNCTRCGSLGERQNATLGLKTDEVA